MRYLILSLLVCTLASLTCPAQQQLTRKVYDEKSNTWAEVTCLTGKLPAFGYAPVRMTINNGTTTELQFNLSFTSMDNTSYGSESGSRLNSSFSCSCPPQSQEVHDFLVPLCTIFQTGRYDSGTALRLKLTSTGYESSNGRMYTELNSDIPSILLSNTLYIPNSSALSSELTTSYSHGSNFEFAGSFDPSAMPGDWRGLQGQDIIMLTSDDWNSLDPGARTAMLEWNRFGGRLIIYTNSHAENFNTLQIENQARSIRELQRSMGTISLLPLPASNKLNATDTVDQIATRRGASLTSYQNLLQDYSASWPLSKVLEEKQFNTGFFIIVLLGFGILVGPINLFVFAKSGQRHRLFITTPLISLVASALLIVIIIFQDGFGGKGHRTILMEIQAEENNAYIIQEQIARTGVLLNATFETSEPATLSPVAMAPSRWTRVTVDGTTPNNYTIDQGESGLKASGDWYQSRSEHGHLLQSVRPTRGSLQQVSKAGSPILRSSFDFNLSTVFYQAADQSWWKAEAIGKGESISLSPSTADEFQAWWKTQAKRFSRHHARQMNKLSLLPNRFYAIATDAPAIESYSAIDWLSTTTVLTGEISPSL
ncbi:hypothetical protein HW115_16715 [Verrucomicrobiaceae bacterium N1E253]|uniref:DUF4350 domain-containing protein n=1 Tax=Oceaniferula marina TaxID=2748318 RepID=A0A851GQJ7_9BACT|nr:hypothetical protein [Oceaniferula marina]NWK57267.1 hypothetical protein [Oceaniferula marina]